MDVWQLVDPFGKDFSLPDFKDGLVVAKRLHAVNKNLILEIHYSIPDTAAFPSVFTEQMFKTYAVRHYLLIIC